MSAPDFDCRLPVLAYAPWGLLPAPERVQVARSNEPGSSVDRASVLPFTPALDAFESVAAYAEKRRTGLEAACVEKPSISFRSAMS